VVSDGNAVLADEFVEVPIGAILENEERMALFFDDTVELKDVRMSWCKDVCGGLAMVKKAPANTCVPVETGKGGGHALDCIVPRLVRWGLKVKSKIHDPSPTRSQLPCELQTTVVDDGVGEVFASDCVAHSLSVKERENKLTEGAKKNRWERIGAASPVLKSAGHQMQVKW
jgi:hypothetical protein